MLASTSDKYGMENTAKHAPQKEKKELLIQERNKRAIDSLLSNGHPIRLELGAGPRRMEGWTSVDLDDKCDICLDLSQPLPFPDACVSQVYSSHLLEHFSYPDPMVNFLSECYRILKPGRPDAPTPARRALSRVALELSHPNPRFAALTLSASIKPYTST